jgi:hypothetical protein
MDTEPPNEPQDEPPNKAEQNNDRNARGQFAKGNRQGKVNSGGRPKGAKNKRNQEFAAMMAKRGDRDPLEFLSSVISGKMKEATLQHKIMAASALAPYMYARRHPEARNTNPIAVEAPATIADTKALLGELIARTLSGELDHDTVAIVSNLLKSFTSTIVGFDLEQMVAEFAASHQYPRLERRQ